MEAFTPELWSNGVAVGVDKAHEVGGGSAEAAVAAEVAMIGGDVREQLVLAGLAVGMPWSDCSGGMAPSGRGPPAPEGRFHAYPHAIIPVTIRPESSVGSKLTRNGLRIGADRQRSFHGRHAESYQLRPKDRLGLFRARAGGA